MFGFHLIQPCFALYVEAKFYSIKMFDFFRFILPIFQKVNSAHLLIFDEKFNNF